MLWTVWLALSSASATPTLDADKICTAAGPVALSMAVYKRVPRRPGPSCPSLVASQRVADYLKAFAVLSRELRQAEVADQLARQVDARWVIVEDGRGYAVYDLNAQSFVDSSLFLTGTAASPSTPAELAFQAGTRAMRSKRYDEARAELNECLRLDADHIGCHWELGWVDWVGEDWRAVVSSWETVASLNPGYPELGRWLPQARAKAGPPPATEPPPRPIAPDAPEPQPDEDALPSHCSDSAATGFSCAIGSKYLSVCWDDAAQDALSVRFGALGAEELRFPRSSGVPFADAFSLEHEVVPSPPGGGVRPRLENTAVRFTANGHQYTVFEELHDFDVHEQGVRVRVFDTEEVTLLCTEPSTRRLSSIPR